MASQAGHGDGLGAAPGPDLGLPEAEDGLVRDVTEVLASFCARRYGRRPARNRAGKELRCAAGDADPASPGVTG